MNAIFHVGMAGGSVIVEPGSWSSSRLTESVAGNDLDAAQARWVKIEVHRSEWNDHIRIEGDLAVDRSVRPPSDGMTDAANGERAVVLPLHGSGMPDAVKLVICSASQWGYGPSQLVLTFHDYDC
jgi:hypothetical protein